MTERELDLEASRRRAVGSVPNRSARTYVNCRRAFWTKNKTMFASWESDRYGRPIYVVWSYGRHFPMYAYLNGQWWENTDHFSRTTERHKSQARPTLVVLIPSTTLHILSMFNPFVRTKEHERELSEMQSAD